jgi:hypothetical protein
MTWLTIESTTGAEHSRRTSDICGLIGVAVGNGRVTRVDLFDGGEIETQETVSSLQRRLNDAERPDDILRSSSR